MLYYHRALKQATHMKTTTNTTSKIAAVTAQGVVSAIVVNAKHAAKKNQGVAWRAKTASVTAVAKKNLVVE